MRGHRFCTVCVCLTLAIRATCCLASDLALEPALGPAEPIGVLLLVSPANVSPQPSPLPLPPQPMAAADDPVLGTPVLLASLISSETETRSIQVPLHPNEIQDPLREAIERLASVGLDGESEQIRAVLTKFERQHAQRLLLERKQAELAVLQAEIDQLKQQDACEDQICLKVKVIERTVKTDKTTDAQAVSATIPNSPTRLTGVLDSTEFDRLIREIEADKSWKILSEPTMTLLSGRTMKYSSGGEFQIPKEQQTRVPNPIPFGTFLTATATVVELERMRVAMELEQSQLDHANAVDGIPGVSRLRMQSTVELQDGQTIVLGGLISSRTNTETNSTEQTETVITVTAELVRPLPGDASLIPVRYYETRSETPEPLPSVK